MDIKLKEMINKKLGVEVHTFNPTIQEAKPEISYFQASLGYTARPVWKQHKQTQPPHIYTKVLYSLSHLSL